MLTVSQTRPSFLRVCQLFLRCSAQPTLRHHELHLLPGCAEIGAWQATNELETMETIPPQKKKNDQNMIQQGWNVKMTVNENKISTYHTYHTYTIMKTYLKHLKKRSKIHQLSTNTLPFKLCPSAPAFGWPESTSITERTWAPKSAPCWPAPKRPQVVTLVTNDHWEPLVTP